MYDEMQMDVKKMKVVFDEIKKEKGLITSGSGNVGPKKKLYFENFIINDISLNFTFSSSPILFREFSMNPSLKFFIVLLSNMKKVSLKFNHYQLRQTQ